MNWKPRHESSTNPNLHKDVLLQGFPQIPHVILSKLYLLLLVILPVTSVGSSQNFCGPRLQVGRGVAMWPFHLGPLLDGRRNGRNGGDVAAGCTKNLGECWVDDGLTWDWDTKGTICLVGSLEPWNFIFHRLGMSSSQLTSIFFRGVGLNHRPDIYRGNGSGGEDGGNHPDFFLLWFESYSIYIIYLVGGFKHGSNKWRKIEHPMFCWLVVSNMFYFPSYMG